MKKTKNKFLTGIICVFALIVMACGFLFVASQNQFVARAAWSGEGNGTSDNPYKIGTKAELEQFRDIVNGLNGEVRNVKAHAVLTADIDLEGSDTNPWTPIAYTDNVSYGYGATFDGDGHTISGLYVNADSSSYAVGLFGMVYKDDYSDGIIKNLTVAGQVIGNVVGGIAGWLNRGTITNCRNEANITGNKNVGGIAGYAQGRQYYTYGVISQCSNVGTITANTNVVGGICGYLENYGSITDCYNLGAINSGAEYNVSKAGGVVGYIYNSTKVYHCYNYATITATGANVGGVIGKSDGSNTITYNYYLAGTATGGVNGSDTNGATSKTAENFKKQSSFTLWDFTNIWKMGENYPVFITIGEMTVTVSGYTGDYDGDEHTISVTPTDPSTGYTITYGTASDSYTLTAAPTYTDAGSYTVYYRITAEGYNDYTGSETVVINKATPTITAPSKITGLAYTGNEQQLITSGSTDGGSLYYKLNDGSYSADVPMATLPGTYVIYYKVIGDNNYNDVEETSVQGTIINAEITDVDAAQSESLFYTGEEQIVDVHTQATVQGGQAITFTYSSSQDGTYGNIPSFTNVGSYTVFFKVSANYHDDASGSFTVMISENDKTILSSAIVDATEFYDSVISDYAEIAETLNTAIETATEVKDDENVTTTQIDNATTALNNALDVAKSDYVIANIDEIGEVVYTTECRKKIGYARKMYNSLTETQKALVTNYAKLTAAEEAYKALDKEDDSKNPDNTDEVKKSDNTIIFIVIGAVVVLGVAGVCVYTFVIRKKKSGK